MYVDDALMTGNNESYIESIKKELKKGFEMIYLEHLHFYLGIEVTQHPKHIFIYQKKYVGELLNIFCMAECNPISTPMEQKLKLTLNEGKFEHANKYRLLVEILIYLTTARTYISYVVGILSRYMHNP